MEVIYNNKYCIESDAINHIIIITENKTGISIGFKEKDAFGLFDEFNRVWNNKRIKNVENNIDKFIKNSYFSIDSFNH